MTRIAMREMESPGKRCKKLTNRFRDVMDGMKTAITGLETARELLTGSRSGDEFREILNKLTTDSTPGLLPQLNVICGDLESLQRLLTNLVAALIDALVEHVDQLAGVVEERPQ